MEMIQVYLATGNEDFLKILEKSFIYFFCLSTQARAKKYSVLVFNFHNLKNESRKCSSSLFNYW